MDQMPNSSSAQSHNHRVHHHHGGGTHHHQQRQQRRGQERGVDMICRVKYGNTLPELPFEPKFLQSPFISLNRFIPYTPSTLEKNYKYELLTEPDLNVKIDLIDPMTYSCDPIEKPPLNPIDEQLLEGESISQLNTRRSIQHRKVVPWMRKTEYISTEFNRYGIGQTGAERPDTKIGYGIKKRIKDEPFEYKDRDSQVAAIQSTFDDIRKPIKRHYSKSGVVTIEEFPIFPDFDLWKFPFAQVIFDADPLPYCKENREQKLIEAVLRGMADAEGNQFVGYFAPTDEALEQRMADDREEFGSYKDGIEYHYKMEREYNWTVQNKGTKGFEKGYFLVLREKAFYYNEMDTKVKLTRRAKSATSKNTLLAVTNREMNAKELVAMTKRENELYGIQEEEVEEDAEAANEQEGEEGGDEQMKEDEEEGGEGAKSAEKQRKKKKEEEEEKEENEGGEGKGVRESEEEGEGSEKEKGAKNEEDEGEEGINTSEEEEEGESGSSESEEESSEEEAN